MITEAQKKTHSGLRSLITYYAETFINPSQYFSSMILSKKELQEVRQALETAKRPLFYYDSDPDGLCSFLLLYRHVKEGKGILVKSTSHLDIAWKKQIDEYKPDVVFILDLPGVSQDFIDAADVPVYWIDHHTPQDRQNVHYYNPRRYKAHAYIPTTRVCYEIISHDVRDEAAAWIAAVGCVADWFVPDFKDAFLNDYPLLMNSDVHDPETALFDTSIGKLARIFSFLLKGKTNHALKCIKILTRISTPTEILERSTPAGKFIMKHFDNVNDKYEALLKKGLKTKPRRGFLVFRYEENHWSFSSDLSNELAHHHPNKVILVCREKNGQFKCSLRSREKPIASALKEALGGIQGKGGGHEYACGAVIESEDFDRFVENLILQYHSI
jgi:single-stranded DNA-specific DHH superfamily exonuclease